MDYAHIIYSEPNLYQPNIHSYLYFNRKNKAKKVNDSLHGFIKGVEEGILVASFPPGKIVHIDIKYSKKPW